MALRRRCVLPLLACSAAWAQTAPLVSFSRDVAPILSQNCGQCHGPSPAMANLDLRSREAAIRGGKHGPAMVPGDAGASRLYRRLTGEEKPQMPMGGRLSDA